jgi:hypothetical protein
MARWQLQCSGKSEENRCKFCQAELPNWRAALFKDVLEHDDEAAEASGLEDGDSDGSVDADGAAMPPTATGRGGRISSVSGGSHGGSSSASSTPGTSSFLPRPEPTDSSATAAQERRRLAALSRRSSVDGSPAANDSSTSMGDVKGDIIVKFNNMSFRCKVRTGHEGLEDFMEQIREKCGIPEHKMRCLNLTYRCKDPNTGSQMTLQGVNESAFDAAVLCSAAQDKIKQRRRASRDGGRRASAEGKPPTYPNGESNGSKEDGVSTSAPASGGPGSSSGGQSDKSSGETSKASGKAKLRGKDLDATAAPASPGKSGRFEYRGCDATSTRAERRRNSLESTRRSDGSIAFRDGSVIAASDGFRSGVSDPDENTGNAPSSGRFYFRRGARRLSAPPPSSSGLATSVANAEADPRTVDAEEASLPLRRARRPWPSFMSALTRSKA